MLSKTSTYSFGLENLDSIESSIIKEPGLLVIAIILFFLSFVFTIDKEIILGFFITLILSIGLVILYFKYCERVLKLSSGRLDIKLNVNKLSDENLRYFIKEIEKAKEQKLESIRQSREITVTKTEDESPEQRLEKHKELFHNGLITEEEYMAKRKEIISKL